MPSAEDIERSCEKFVAAMSKHDVDAVAALFAPDAVVHDPVDTPAIEGVEKIREFFAQGVGALQAMKLSGPVHISGDCRHAAFRLEAVANLGDGLKVIEGVDVWTFGDDGRIATMNAYWGPTSVRDA